MKNPISPKSNQQKKCTQDDNSLLKVRSKSVYPIKKVVNVNLELPSHYQLVEKVGQGSFGEIYKIYNTKTLKLQACKVEFKDQKQQPQQQQLLPREYKVLSALWDIKSQQQQSYQLITGQDYNMIIMPYFGFGNLEELRKKCKDRKFSKRTIFLMAQTLISSIEQLHSYKYVHRDIKPENFIVGSVGDHHKIYLIDFGLAKQYVDENGNNLMRIFLYKPQGNHIQMTQNKGMVGTARYTSINSHRGLEQSRRDDLEAIGYVLLYLYIGQVPWQNFPFPSQTRQEKFQKICEEKVQKRQSLFIKLKNKKKVKFQSNLMTEVDCPIELRKYFDYIKTIQFDQKPDYYYLKSLFQNRIHTDQRSCQQCQCYDWCPDDCTITQLENEYDIVSNEVPYLRKLAEKRGGTTTQGTTDINTDKFKMIDRSRFSVIQNIQENEQEQSIIQNQFNESIEIDEQFGINVVKYSRRQNKMQK